VIDTGIGIPRDKLESVFESYTQAYTDTTRKFGGTGLGLAITRQLVLLQNGEIMLDSEVGKGTTFSVRIPFMKCNQNTATSKEYQVSDEDKDLSMFEILLVEDNPINQMVAQQVLENWFAKVEFADDGLQAVEKLKQKDYSLVLMDLQMPVMNGYQATDFIRNKVNRVKNPDIPIIALTADAFPETKRKVMESGMNDFVTKPLEQNDLYNKIKLHALELAVTK
jgi:CheY-like chemotaxis protein